MSFSTLEKKISEKHPLFCEREAILEAERCLYCYEPPCVRACPTNIDIPNFIRKIGSKDTLSAAKTIFSANILGDSCAKVCPVEVLCAGACVLNHREEPPIEIGRLQRFATETSRKQYEPEIMLGPKKTPSGKKIALIGAGAASLAAAGLLALEGHQTFIFDKRPFAGGLNAYGIAPYKLSFGQALEEIDWLAHLGLTFYFNTDIDEAKAQEILADYDAVFLGVGLGEDRFLNCMGIDYQGVFGATDIIEKIKTDPNFNLEGVERAHVVGGGNTAIDIAHELALLKVPYVAMLYRGDEATMSGYAHEMAQARASGVHLFPKTQVREIHGHNGKLTAFKNDDSEIIKTDLLVLAIGQQGGTKCAEFFPGIERNAHSLIVVNEHFRTGNEKVWSAGDAVNGGKEVVNAVAEAKIAVKDMLRYLQS